jgi:hypothetical protein
LSVSDAPVRARELKVFAAFDRTVWSNCSQVCIQFVGGFLNNDLNGSQLSRLPAAAVTGNFDVTGQ